MNTGKTKTGIREYLKRHYLIADGAFGTYYGEKYHTQELPELANLFHKERVTEIYGEYLDAGADLIRTNTFAANTAVLQESAETVEELIGEAVCLAQTSAEEHARATGRQIFVAGDIGPIPTGSEPDYAAVEQEYERIARSFIAKGVSILNFETFPDTEHILPVIHKIRQEYDIFVMISFSVNQFGYSASGLSARRLLSEAAKSEDIDAVGLNCGVSAGHMCQLYDRMELPSGKYLMALPNAGYPVISRSQLQFGNTISYFAGKMQDMANLGVDILGGCCGTNPGFIREISKRIRKTAKQTRISVQEQPENRKMSVRKGFLYDENGVRKQKKMIAVELAPPFDADDEKLLESAHILKNANVDVLTFPDSPSGRTRVDSVLMAAKVRQETGMEVMPHVCCRDKNALAIRSLLMGARINEIHNMLVITGDPLPSMARQTVKAVFQFDSVGLMKLAKEMNEDILSDQPLCYGGAINQGRRNFEVEMERVKRKMGAGAEFFMTQPVFTKEDADRLRLLKKETGAYIFCGVMPLVSRKNALFMKNEIAGVNVTDEIIGRYPENGTRQQGETVGVALAKEVIAMVDDFADGYYFTFPFNRIHMLEQIMR